MIRLTIRGLLLLSSFFAFIGCNDEGSRAPIHTPLFLNQPASFQTCEPGFAVEGDVYTYAETTNSVDAVFSSWVDSVTDSTMWLDVEIYHDLGWGISSPGIYQFTEKEASYHTCSLCLVAWSEQWTKEGWVEKVYMPVAHTGSANITDVSVINDPEHGNNPIGKSFAGSLDVIMQEVSINYDTWVATPVPNGCRGRLAYHWNDTIKTRDKKPCNSKPSSGSFQKCSQCFGDGGYTESYSGDWQDGEGFIVYNSWVNSRTDAKQWLDIESYIDWGGPSKPGTFHFTELDSAYDSCILCVIAWTGQWTQNGWVEKTFMPAGDNSGTAQIKSIDSNPNPAGNFTGVLDVIMQEVTIDYNTWETIPVPGGCTGRLVYQWDTPTSQ